MIPCTQQVLKILSICSNTFISVVWLKLAWQQLIAEL